jgi:polyisoprenoid-binding protein YceI
MSLAGARRRRAAGLAGGLALLLAACPRALAAPVSLELDPAQTRVEFTLAETFGSVRGTFRLKRGLVHFDPATGTASGVVVIDAASGDSGNRLRDREMHQAVLDSPTYAEITFAPTQVHGTVAPSGESRVEVAGTLDLHGARHPVTLVVLLKVAGERLTADARFVVPYVQWGLKNPSLFLLRVGDSVEVHVSAAGRFAPPLDAASK